MLSTSSAAVPGELFLKLISQHVQEHEKELLAGDLKFTLNPPCLTYLVERNAVLQRLMRSANNQLRLTAQDRTFLYVIFVMSKLPSVRIEPTNTTLSAIPDDSFALDLDVFASLTKLEIRRCRITSVRGLAATYPHIRRLVCDGSLRSLRDVLVDAAMQSPGSGAAAVTWPELTILRCPNNRLRDIDDSIQGLPALQVLDLSHNELSKLRNLEHCYSLRHVDLSYNLLINLSDINTHLGNIVTLSLAHNSISSTDGLNRLFSLQVLDLSSNLVADLGQIKRLQKLPFLRALRLRGNPICKKVDYRSVLLEVFGEVRDDDGDDQPVFELDGFPIDQPGAFQTPESKRKKRTRVPVIAEGDAETMTVPAVPPSSSPRSTSQHSDVESYQNKIESLRNESGPSWLVVLSEMEQERLEQQTKKEEARKDPPLKVPAPNKNRSLSVSGALAMSTESRQPGAARPPRPRIRFAAPEHQQPEPKENSDYRSFPTSLPETSGEEPEVPLASSPWGALPTSMSPPVYETTGVSPTRGFEVMRDTENTHEYLVDVIGRASDSSRMLSIGGDHVYEVDTDTGDVIRTRALDALLGVDQVAEPSTEPNPRPVIKLEFLVPDRHYTDVCMYRLEDDATLGELVHLLSAYVNRNGPASASGAPTVPSPQPDEVVVGTPTAGVVMAEARRFQCQSCAHVFVYQPPAHRPNDAPLGCPKCDSQFTIEAQATDLTETPVSTPPLAEDLSVSQDEILAAEASPGGEPLAEESPEIEIDPRLDLYVRLSVIQDDREEQTRIYLPCYHLVAGAPLATERQAHVCVTNTTIYIIGVGPKDSFVLCDSIDARMLERILPGMCTHLIRLQVSGERTHVLVVRDQRRARRFLSQLRAMVPGVDEGDDVVDQALLAIAKEVTGDDEVPQTVFSSYLYERADGGQFPARSPIPAGVVPRTLLSINEHLYLTTEDYSGVGKRQFVVTTEIAIQDVTEARVQGDLGLEIVVESEDTDQQQVVRLVNETRSEREQLLAHICDIWRGLFRVDLTVT